MTALRCVQPRYSARTGSMCMKMMNDGGWAQQLGCHACPRHSVHLCRRSPHPLRRLGAASSRSRWKAALVDRRCWFSATGANFRKSSGSWLQQARGARLTRRSHRQKEAGRHAYELQLALTMSPIFGGAGQHNLHSVLLEPPQRGPIRLNDIHNGLFRA